MRKEKLQRTKKQPPERGFSMLTAREVTKRVMKDPLKKRSLRRVWSSGDKKISGVMRRPPIKKKLDFFFIAEGKKLPKRSGGREESRHS